MAGEFTDFLAALTRLCLRHGVVLESATSDQQIVIRRLVNHGGWSAGAERIAAIWWKRRGFELHPAETWQGEESETPGAVAEEQKGKF